MNASFHSPRTVILAVTIAGAIFIFCLTAVGGLLGIGGTLLAVGVWKGNVDQRMTYQENSTKEQIAALKEGTDKQVQAVLTASKEMVSAVERSTDKRLTDIETDRRAKLEEFARYRSAKEGQEAKMDALLTNQQEQIKTLTDLATRNRKP